MPTVLLVDDEPDMLFVWRHILTNAGYTVRVAVNGVAALDQLRIARPQLVVTDWMMPVLNGNELCRAIRSDQELCGIPVLVFTAVSRRPVQGRPMWDEWLVKPASRDHFLATVARLCMRK
ncbi:response regulator [Paraburkholderia sp. 22B1P]|uniref:response regulator n=1 Tax=Paraburkholderia sp. 22B1P TaxID=3080498 RepID=UPI00308DEDBF|nr:response regulator [Paraburkholderia sp. 22B1P]